MSRRRNRLPAVAAAVITAALVSSLWTDPGRAAEGGFPLVPGSIPNYSGLGIGAAPDYLGSDEYLPGGLPFGRVSRENRYVSLEGNYLSVNLVNHPVFRAGPAGLYRFGRRDVDDDVVDELPGFNDTIELGAFAGLEFVDDEDPRKRFRLSADFLHDIGDVHRGYVASASLRAWHPLARGTQIGAGLAVSYGSDDYMSTFFGIDAEGAARSGLPRYDAEAGLRDARATLVVVQSLSRNWHVGAGLLYSRLLSEAADSPVVDPRGSANQFLGGIGFAYSW